MAVFFMAATLTRTLDSHKQTHSNPEKGQRRKGAEEMRGQLLFPFSPFLLCISHGTNSFRLFDVSTSLVLAGRGGLIQLKETTDLR
jgi:hypothetical protein